MARSTGEIQVWVVPQEAFDAADESWTPWMGSGVVEWAASYDEAEEVPAEGYSTVTIQTWQGDEFTITWSDAEWRLPIDTAPIGDVEIEPVRLDECWRCSVTIPKEDPLGLCDPCRVQLRNL